MSAPIDLDALKAEAESDVVHPILGDGALVTRRYLKSVELELRRGRAAETELEQLKLQAVEQRRAA